MRRDVQEIFKMTPRDKQVMMFSATLSKEIRPVCKKFMQDVMSCGPTHFNCTSSCLSLLASGSYACMSIWEMVVLLSVGWRDCWLLSWAPVITFKRQPWLIAKLFGDFSLGIGLSTITCAHSECLWWSGIFSCHCELFRGECGVRVWEGDYMVDLARPVLILSVAVFLLYWDSTASVQIASGATMSWSVQTNLLFFWLEFLYQAQLAWSNPSTQCITEATGGRKILTSAESIDIPSGKARVALVPALISLSIICCLTAYGNLCWWWG